MVLLIRQFFLGLARRGSCQIGPKHFCKPQVGHLGRQSNSLNFKAEERNQRRLDRVHCASPPTRDHSKDKAPSGISSVLGSDSLEIFRSELERSTDRDSSEPTAQHRG
jgi:hypothetical protein